ncbi:MAG TPA: PHB depolymerase family esterase [Acidimicrobiales bacterium]|nr:PHB depolymerase family esterase [Acidimicrobiales bacterium]
MRRRVAVVLVCLAAVLAACDGGGAVGSDEPCRGLAPGRSEHGFFSGGVRRRYLLYVPETAEARPRPLIVTMHGYGASAAAHLDYTRAETAAERHDVLVLAPMGFGQPASFDLFGSRDVAFVTAAVDHVARRTCVDLSRVYATGMSNGAAMAAVLACRSPGTFAAIAPVAAIVYPADMCAGRPPAPVMAFMGTADPIVPFGGGAVTCCGGWSVAPAPDAMQHWARHNGCDELARDEPYAGGVTRRSWSNCDEGVETVFYVVDGGGHTWPGASAAPSLGATTRAVDATSAIWEFFARTR